MPSPDDAARAGLPLPPLLAARGLCCRRGGRQVLTGLDFELRPGELLELRGANGSGKTTLLRLLAGLVPASGGTLAWGDAQSLARGVAFLGHLNGLSADLTAAESLDFARRLDGSQTLENPGGLAGAPSPDSALRAWGLAGQARQPVRRLSQGQRRRLALARVWMARRPVWLLDEPCAGLDAEGERLFDERLTAHLRAGGSAVVATHRTLDVPAGLRRVLGLGVGLDLARDGGPRPARLAGAEDAPAEC